MGVKETIKEFLTIWQAVYADDELDQEMRSAKLEKMLKDLLKGAGLPEDRKLCVENPENSGCKAYVAQAVRGIYEADLLIDFFALFPNQI